MNKIKVFYHSHQPWKQVNNNIYKMQPNLLKAMTKLLLQVKKRKIQLTLDKSVVNLLKKTLINNKLIPNKNKLN
jgi:hypothetical protein